jgi:uncharacterized phage protein (TIGR01671 family)
MERQIKFRGKSTDTNEWVYGYYGIKGSDTDLETHFIMTEEFQANVTIPFFYFYDNKVDKKTIGQFTGLKDVNGVDVYEGDICITKRKLTDGIIDLHNGIVTWNNTTMSYYFHSLKSEISRSFGGQEIIEVIGNIYENESIS